MLVPMKEILVAAQKGGYGVIAPNVINETTARACIDAAVDCKAPIILDFGYVFHPDIVFLGRIMEQLAKDAPVPVAINLDHGAEFSHAIWAIRAGFTSIMVDRSNTPLEQNIAQTSELVKIAHAVGVSVEAELGHVGMGDSYAQERDAGLTDPGEAADYVRRTGVDCLAVAVGTAHGPYTGTPHLDFDRLAAIAKVVDIPLVLHGGSGSGDENLVKAIRLGITKINLATDLFRAGVDAAREPDPVHMTCHYFRDGWYERLVHYIKLFGQAGRA